MRSGVCAAVLLLFFGGALWAEPLVDPELPTRRVRDAGDFMSPPARSLLSDYLEILARDQKIEIYVVILQKESAETASRLCDRWQAEWVPKGQGGVYVYSVLDRKYCFEPTPETLRTLGDEKLGAMFRKSVEQPPLRESLDLVISLPVLRIVAAIGAQSLDHFRNRAELAESQQNRWQVIAAMAGAFALVGWLLCFSKWLKIHHDGSERMGVPAPGMAYRNPPKRSRGGRRSRHGGPEAGEESEGGGERRSRKDRF